MIDEHDVYKEWVFYRDGNISSKEEWLKTHPKAISRLVARRLFKDHWLRLVEFKANKSPQSHRHSDQHGFSTSVCDSEDVRVEFPKDFPYEDRAKIIAELTVRDLPKGWLYFEHAK